MGSQEVEDENHNEVIGVLFKMALKISFGPEALGQLSPALDLSSGSEPQQSKQTHPAISQKVGSVRVGPQP